MTRPRTGRTEAAGRALPHAPDHEREATSLVEDGMAFAQALRAKAGPCAGRPVDKDYVDSLYDDGLKIAIRVSVEET